MFFINNFFLRPIAGAGQAPKVQSSPVNVNSGNGNLPAVGNDEFTFYKRTKIFAGYTKRPKSLHKAARTVLPSDKFSN